MKENNKPTLKSVSGQFLKIDDMMPLIKECLLENRSVEILVRGASMLPTLKEGRDSVVLSRLEREPKKYDVVLYSRSDGSYVLHRIVKVGESYTAIGDAQYVYESGILRESIIAIAVAFRKNGRLISADSVRNRIYSLFWTKFRPLRRFLKRARRKIYRMLRRKK